MMIKLLNDNPDLKQYFPKFKDKSAEQLRSDEDFEEMALAHINAYDQAIQDSDNVDQLIKNLHGVGRRHKALPGFQEDYLARMEKCLVFALKSVLGDAYTDNMERIYQIWISWTTEQMREGFRS
ncbi:hypothetical protein BV898_13477 [Hypsibius exemplaris]|uniref:Globin domain-containing protein n=1 Tax=Hypsibius exemplaris TaxID=2072580 RepID=A0A1W0WAN4_HYPEX|nr:hypothetical protein BV898_13477 [Hypsibius exemplaris]